MVGPMGIGYLGITTGNCLLSDIYTVGFVQHGVDHFYVLARRCY